MLVFSEAEASLAQEDPPVRPIGSESLMYTHTHTHNACTQLNILAMNLELWNKAGGLYRISRWDFTFKTKGKKER